MAQGVFEWHNRDFRYILIGSGEDILSETSLVNGLFKDESNDCPFSIIHALSSSLPDHISQNFLSIYRDDELVALVSIQRVDFKLNQFVNNTSAGMVKKLGLNLASTLGGSVFNGHIWVMGHLLLTGFPFFKISRDILPVEISPFEFLIAAFSSLKFNLPNQDKIISLAIMQVQRNTLMQEMKFPKFWKGYPIDPVMRLEIDPEWGSFEDYYQSLRSRYRKKARSVLNNSQELEIVELDSREVRKKESRIFYLLNDLLKNIPFNIIYPRSDFFDKNLSNLSSYRFFGVFLKNELVGFFSCLKHGKIMEGHFLGYDRKFNQELSVYKFMLFALVSKAITEGCDYLYLGRTASIAKLNLGADPLPSSMIMMPIKPGAKRLLGLYYKNLYKKELPQLRNVFR